MLNRLGFVLGAQGDLSSQVHGKRNCRGKKRGSEERREPRSYHRGRTFLLTRILRTRPHPPRGSGEPKVAAEIQGRGGEVCVAGGGEERQPGRPGGESGERREERDQCTWSQPPSFPSLLPGSPRLHRTPWLPGPPHPYAQPLQTQPLLALRTPRLSYRRVSWRGGKPPHVAKVSSWTWRRTPGGLLRAREMAALEPGRLLSLSEGSKDSPPLTAFSCYPPATLGEDSDRDFHWDAPAAATIQKGRGGGRVNEKKERFLALQLPPHQTSPTF
ncbi:uncharacterized protein LOC126057325 [Elephas maximus indicus]|uniref:uncharacterized protein LOC126057325 n=1 Tax=Elephas maximus indicus TaxID=99487 RepID=UPI002116670F|nr:uncharacterized protein LOC126057325 [Elephas maximus indicus]